MRYKIPSDLSTENLKCFKVMWPDTPEWRSLLAGALYSVARGRSWDERTGSVVDAAAAGRVLFGENVPLVGCDGEQETLPPQVSLEDYVASFGWSDCEEGCEEMGGCCISDLRWNAGVLEMLRCGQWVVVGDGMGAGSVSPVTSGGIGSGGFVAPETGEGAWLEGILPEGQEHNPDCEKAYIIGNAMWEVLEACYEKRDVIFYLGPSRVKAALPQYSLDWVDLEAVINIMRAVEIAPGSQFETFFSQTEKQRLICYLQTLMSDEYVMDSTEVAGIHVALLAYGGFSPELEDFAMGQMLYYTWSALGVGTIKELALGAQSLTHVPDCSCPGAVEDLEPWEEANQDGWYFSQPVMDVYYDHTANDGDNYDNGWNYVSLGELTLPHDVFGVMIDMLQRDPSTGQGFLRIASNYHVPTASPDGLWSDSGTEMGLGRWIWSNVALAQSVMGFYPYISVNSCCSAGPGGTWSIDPQAPTFTIGLVKELIVVNGIGLPKNCHFQIRLLYNSNSPSHAL